MDRETAELRRKAVEFMKGTYPFKDGLEEERFTPEEMERIAERLLDPKTRRAGRKTRTGVRFSEICRRMLKGETIWMIAGSAYANALAREVLMEDLAETYGASFGFFCVLDEENAARLKIRRRMPEHHG